MNRFKIFIVEDDLWYLQVLEYYLSKDSDYDIVRFSSGKECLDNLHQRPHLITLDYNLPDTDGMQVLKKIKSLNADIPIIFISGQDDPALIKTVLDKGATDFFVKDENTRDLLLNSINRIKDNHDLKEELEQLKVELGQKYEIQKIALGESNSIKKTYALIEKASQSNINVSLSGETGTGKRLFAKAIHFNSNRSNKPFISVDISAIPKDLVDVELFGQETTNASGIVSSRVGKIEQADGGTLFLQNISELEMNIQAKLLYFLEEKCFYKQGGEKLISSDVRFICSSSKDLAEELRLKNLREDLFYAMMRMPISLPPLRERGSDIIILAKHILNQYCIENNVEPKVLSSAACEKLLAYPFPGNIHELKSLMQFALVMSNTEQIEVSDLMFTKIANEINLFPEEKTMREYTINIVQSFLRRYDGNVLKVAEKLDIGKSTIYKMIQEKEIVP